MKKWIGLFLFFVLMLITAGCENNNSSSRSGNQSASVNDVLEAEMAEEDSKNKDNSQDVKSDTDSDNNERQSGVNKDTPKSEPIDVDSTEDIDVDLTVLSSTMVYSEVYNMIFLPENYIGKTVKMDGIFALYYDEVTYENYFACVIADAAACCSQGIEFVLTDDYIYPDDYPKEGEDICVVGVFDTYQDGGYTYCTLKNARLL